MEVRTLVQFIEVLNDEIALFSKLLKPSKVILVSSELPKRDHEQSLSDTKLNDVLAFMKSEARQTEVIQMLYKENELNRLEEQLVPYLKQDTMVNMAGATPLEMMMIMALNSKFKISLAYPNIKDNTLYLFESDHLQRYKLSEVVGNLLVNDFLSLTGGSILRDERQRYKEPAYEKMLAYLLKSYKQNFAPIREYFKPSYVKFSTNDEEPFYFSISLKHIKPTHKQSLLKCLEELAHMGWVNKVTVMEQAIRVFTKNKEMEHYLTSGAWLEHVTYHFVSKIINQGDVHTGFKFAWRASNRHVHNEIDVIATCQNRLIGISCKDTANYDYQTLNELSVYMMKLGGPLAIKILVATKLPLKKSTVVRAQEMDIYLIQVQEDLEALEEALKRILVVK